MKINTYALALEKAEQTKYALCGKPQCAATMYAQAYWRRGVVLFAASAESNAVICG